MPRRTAPVPFRVRPLLTLTMVTSTAAGLLSLLGAPEAVAAEPSAATGPSATAGGTTAGGSAAAVRPRDKLTFTVAHSGRAAHDGSYTLRCHPPGGRHAAPSRACAALDRATSQGRDPFKPVAAGATCTMIYGGPATARVTGTWQGRKIDARFSRTNGCEVARWNSLVPALPRTSS
ncbi:SSI family serine proteinase inhibitor [Streptomyces smyrnaeus]|uniref:SSI family serine proteinase inhibitor n=1 Tax=Streptomyces smyrnaeus TaxID=1387713 RepID=UPI0036C88C8C